MPYFRFYPMPRSPLARLLMLVVGTLLGLALLAFGLVFGLAILAVGLVGYALRSLMGGTNGVTGRTATSAPPPGVIEGEFEVVRRDSSAPRQ